jgi:hypothetical protein
MSGNGIQADVWSGVDVRCYPTSDARFTSDVQAMVEEWVNGDVDTDTLAARLAPTYPAVKVVRQDSLASLGKRPVLYAYRDGTP